MRSIKDALRLFDQHTTPVPARVLTLQGERMLSVAVHHAHAYREHQGTSAGAGAAAMMNVAIEVIAAGTELSCAEVMRLVMARMNGGAR